MEVKSLKKYTSVTLPIELLAVFDLTIKGKGYSSRAEFVKQAIRHEINRVGGV